VSTGSDASHASDLPFRQLAQSLPTPCWISDAEGSIQWVNDAWIAYTGMDVAAIEAQGLRRLHDPEIYPEVRRRWAEAKAAAQPVEMVFPLLGQDGRLRPFLTRVVPLRDGEGRITRWFGVNTDISAQSEIEMARRQAQALAERLDAEVGKAAEAERQLQRFWDASRDLLAIISVADGLPRRLSEAAWRDTLGYDAQSLARMRIVNLVHPEDRERTLTLRDALAHGGRVDRFENRYRHADGRWVWLSWNVVREGEFDYAIARDITESIRAREALAQSERQFRLLVAGVIDYALFMLSPEGVVTSWNAGAEHIKGYAAGEIVGRHFSQFYTAGDRDAGVPERALATAKAQGRYEAEGWRVRKDGSLFWANVVIDAVYDETGALMGLAKITRDMTERRDAQLELQRAHAHLAQAQKMEAIGQLTGGVAHDFNNLLMIIGGQAQMLRRRMGDAPEPMASRALDAIDVSVRRGQDLTRQLLAFARRQRLNPRAVALGERAQSLRQLISTSVGSAIRLSVDLPEDLWPVAADPSELDLALLNLAVNARDAMPSGGEIRLTGRNAVVAPGELEGELAGEFVAITLADTGAGIPDDILPRVFEPFFTTKEVNKGTGLGLSQVYGFAQQSGGLATIASQLGHGTSITLYLPRASGAADAPEAETASAPACHILLVEDNPDVAEVAAGLLAQLGHRARVVSSADAALQLLQAGERPELLFTDVVMAGAVDGLTLARKAREFWPDLPIVLATGYSVAAERMPPGEFPVLAKPYQLSDLDRVLSRALNLRRVEPAEVSPTD
jgi:PAS domain S-box-containing protein